AKQIVKKVRLKSVGVFADAKIEDVVVTCYALKLSAVQLHGDEIQEYIDTLKSKINRNGQIRKAYPVYKTLPSFFDNVDY
ncbi:bifunctional indole-3-glycerol phosphate synthase/phosphoribosylanthranilate isomerase, partial [Francisella tularensis subsp. holarctica]|nr:bifunctional indole-3-glycerol phosphate synthase/phosphoribosylanthranilate isomerase [Francisella tularensis subsp. holarctica]